MKKLVIIGAGGHGKVVADAAAKSGYYQIVFLDDGQIASVGSRPVVGKVSAFENYLSDSEFVVAIGSNSVRERIQVKIRRGGGDIVVKNVKKRLMHIEVYAREFVEERIGCLILNIFVRRCVA